MKYFYNRDFYNYFIILFWLSLFSLTVKAQALMPGVYDWESFPVTVHATSTNTAPATWEIGNGFTAVTTGNGNGSQIRVLIGNSLSTKVLRYDALAGAQATSAILKSTSGVDFGIKQFNIWPSQNEAQLLEIYVKRDGVTIDTIQPYYQPTTPIHKITISSNDYPFLANIDELEIFNFTAGIMLDDIEVVINQPPIAIDDAVTVTEDVPATGNVLTNDSDPEGNALTASLVTAPVNGTVVLNADGSFTYTPNANYNGLDSLIYQVCDNGTPSFCDTARLRFTVTAVNKAPIAVDDELTVSEDIPATGNVLTNDSDPEGDALTASLVTAPVNGTVVLNADGSFTYTPNANYSGLDSLIYQVCDNGTPSLCDTAWVHFMVEAVNDDPTISGLPSDISVQEDATEDELDISSATISDIDAASGELTLTLDATGGIFDIATGTGITAVGNLTSHLMLTGNLTELNHYISIPSNIYFRPDQNLSGDNAAFVEVSINDNGNTGSGGGNNIAVGTINIDIAPVNDAPVAVDDEITVEGGTPASGNVLTNDSDPEGNALTASLVTAPVNGTVILSADGSFTYTPNADYDGVDSLIYQVCDNGTPSLCDTATVRFTVTAVNDAPVAVDNEVTLNENTPATGNVLTNDSDPEGDALTASLVTAPVNGTIVLNADGSFTYTPNANYIGRDSLIYQVCDNGAPSRCDTAMVRFIVNAGNPRINTVSTTTSNGLYKLGDEINIAIVFNQAVIVQALGTTPLLALNTGSLSRDAEYVSGSGTDVLTFKYTVQVGDSSSDLDYLSTAALRLNGATIRNDASLDADLTLPVVGGANSFAGKYDIAVDGIAPISSSVLVPSNGYYRTDDSLIFTVNFNESVIVDGTDADPYLSVTIGETVVQAPYVAGSGTNALIFTYIVQNGDLDLDGIALNGSIGNNGVIYDSAGNEASAILNGVPSTAGIFVNTIQPSVTLSTTASSPVNGPFTVTATFSEAVTGFILGDIVANNATLSSLQTADNISYSFLVTPTVGGTIQASIPAGVAVNIGNNGNSASNILSIQYTTTITGVTLEDSSFVYDGTTKSLAIAGTLPAGTTVSYANNSRTDVGTQEVTATVSGANYEDLVLTANLSISKATITGITLEDSSFVYDGTAQSLAIDGTLPQGTTVSYANNSRTDVGTQEVTATVSGVNYEDLVLTANLSITEATIRGITLEDSSFVYDGTAKSLAIAGTLPAGTSVSYANNSRTDVGTQEVTATVSGDNYTDLVLTANLSISKATITGITLEDSSFVYDGTTKSLAISGTLPAGTSVSYANNSRTDVGTQEVTATVSGANYEDLVLTANLSITEATIRGITLEDSSFVYDGMVKSLAIAGTLPAGTSVSYANNSRTDVGTQEVTATVSGANYEDLVLTANLSITEATITGISLEDSSFVYDGTAQSLAIDGTLPQGTTVSYANNSRTDVGTQEVTATVSGDNYTDLVLTANLSITKAAIRGITLEDSSFVYDGMVKSLAISGTLPAGTSVSYANNSRTDVGTQEVTATVSGANYEDLVLTANLSITEATIRGITLEDSSFVYDGMVKSLAIAGTLPAGTSVSYANNSRTDVGTQEVTATVSGANYEDLVLTANLSITEATIRGITLEDSSFVYDGTTKSLAIAGTLPAGTSVSYANNSRTDVGTQEVTATVSGANYEDLVLTANLSISKATITGITLEDSSFVYDGMVKSLAISGTLPAGTRVSYANNSRTDVGTQEVTATVSGDNYTDLVLTANLSITEATIRGITLEDSSFVYDGTTKSLAISGTLPAGTSVSYANNSRTDVGTQEVTATVSGANYEDLVLTANLSITEATIRGITLEDSSFVYDGTAKSLAIAGTLPAGTRVSYANNSRTDVGTQEVTATVSGVNYEDLVLTANLSITEATIRGITLEDSSFVYDGTTKSLAIAGTLPAGTSVSYANNSRTDVGTQEVTATISGENYTQLILKANLDVRPVERGIDFAALPEKTYGDSDFDVRATANSGEVISYSSSNTGVATISVDGRIHITGAGETIIAATVPENGNYNNKPTVSRKLIVKKAAQEISFAELGEVARDAGSVSLVVSASSSLPVKLEVNDPQVATISGTNLNILRLGTVTITAYQEGDANYEAASPVSITVRVEDDAEELPIRVHKALSPNGDGINEFLMIEGVKDYPNNKLTIVDRNGMTIIEMEGYNNEDKVFRGLGPGNNPIPTGTYYYLLEVKIDGSWKYKKGYFVVRY